MKKIILSILMMAIIFLMPIKIFAYSDGEVLAAVNVVRNENSLKNLKENKQLDKAAEDKLADIQKYQYWSHDNPTTKKNWISFIREAGFKNAAGENLAKGFLDTNKIMTAWLESPGHRKNLLSSNFNSVGIAIGEVNYDSKIEKVVVLTFGKQSVFSFLN